MRGIQTNNLLINMLFPGRPHISTNPDRDHVPDPGIGIVDERMDERVIAV